MPADAQADMLGIAATMIVVSTAVVAAVVMVSIVLVIGLVRSQHRELLLNM